MKHAHTKHYLMCNGLWAREHLFLSHYHIRGRAGRACHSSALFFSVHMAVFVSPTRAGIAPSSSF
jgi:hypothetical protein